MISVQCVGRRRLEVTKRDDGTYEIKIMLTGPELRIATLVVKAEEFGKLGELFK